ncbi:hypothetical protein F2Q68_00006390 [Brassica cretica]|uniref:Uncharacterized protein n=2 Tax=Brassica cretica TaxID=69181 RepID=A0ABQ7BZF4_BRACR|nr:hypothetical protein F2Q68_00006390 [Brassica cretica]KAF3545259.1 hypothetical protein DY000_02009839 [Brassica cretica]
MAKKSCVSILCFLIIIFSAISVSAQTCDETAGNFKPDTPYDMNRRLINFTLASNVTVHDGNFYGWMGLDPDIVYAVGMCSPGAGPEACSQCIQDTSDSLLKSCPNQTDSFTWLGEEFLCLVHYSRKPFSGVLILEPSKALYNSVDIEKENLKEFDSVWDELMSRTMTSLVRNNLSTPTSKYYENEIAPVPGYKNISVLMQCTPDVSSEDCKLCLEKSVDYYKTLHHGKRGGIVLRPSCFLRWELYTFSGVFDHIRMPPPSSPPLPSPPPSKRPFVVTNMPVKGKSFCFFTNLMLVLQIAESVQFDLKTIEAATSNFSASNKLGQGGFGEVYKGMLMNGTEVAVKRLSKKSRQGEVEFKNEVVVVAKLQHRNLVKLLGFSLQGEEKLLVYEFIPNKSLDYFLFDPKKRIQLDWTMRCNIIGGITRGILYLHQDSRLKIIHRDPKASNILLDSDMNPKIADFGMARIFGMDQNVANTSRVVGTFGYMPPEYVTHGQFSIKSDVYSFGVLILEIISGKKNSSFYQMEGLVNNLVTYVWRLWENKSLHELIDPVIREESKRDEVIRYIHIGLLCVQENSAERPTMSRIHQMLTTSSITLDVPLPPGFLFRNGPESNPLAQRLEPGEPTSMSFACSLDEATITDVSPR